MTVGEDALGNALRLLPGLESAQQLNGAEYLTYANSTGSVWILPADSRYRRTALALYAPQKLRGRALRLAMSRGILSRARVRLDSEGLSDLGGRIASALGEPPVTMAFYAGTPSAYRKVTACVIGDSGKLAGFAKIASLGPSKLLVHNERDVLTELSVSDGLRGRVPQVISEFEWRGSHVLVLTAGPSKRGPGRLGTPHLDFLSRLHCASVNPGRLTDSASWSSASETIEHLGSRMPDVWADRYALARERLAAGLGSRTIPLSRAHRDFTPWNTTIGSHGLFVFDWEMSRGGLPPLYDVFHFAAASAALLDRPLRIPSVAEELLSRHWPQGSSVLEELWLAYLTDISLHYTKARLESPTEGGDTMWNWQGRELDRVLARA